MILKLKVKVPSSADHDETVKQLLLAAVSREGITLVTGKRHYVDVDLVDVERGA